MVFRQLRNKKKKQETEIDLINTIRKQQYETLSKFYSLFATFMALYRLINSDFTNLSDNTAKKEIFLSIIKAESEIDALILKIGCEFSDGNDTQAILFSFVASLSNENRQRRKIYYFIIK